MIHRVGGLSSYSGPNVLRFRLNTATNGSCWCSFAQLMPSASSVRRMVITAMILVSELCLPFIRGTSDFTVRRFQTSLRPHLAGHALLQASTNGACCILREVCWHTG